MIRMCHYVTYCNLLLCLSFLTPFNAMSAPEPAFDLQRIEQQISLTRNQLTQVSSELRDAKMHAAEKMMEYEVSRDAFQREQDPVNASAFDHAQQRLALAEMGVESKAARFERIQRKLEALAAARQEILAEPPPQHPVASINTNEPNTKTTSLSLAPGVVKQGTAKPALSVEAAKSTDRATTLPLVTKILQQGVSKGPVLSRQGKVSDAYHLNAELRNLEHHLVNHSAVSTEPVYAKVYGTAIAGEIPLAEMGGNQFFARFPAPVGTASLIVGARHADGYVRTELQMTFSESEQGKEFVLIFDINTKDQPRALVFQESLAFTQEMFASHSDF